MVLTKLQGDRIKIKKVAKLENVFKALRVIRDQLKALSNFAYIILSSLISFENAFSKPLKP